MTSRTPSALDESQRSPRQTSLSAFRLTPRQGPDQGEHEPILRETGDPEIHPPSPPGFGVCGCSRGAGTQDGSVQCRRDPSPLSRVATRCAVLGSIDAPSSSPRTSDEERVFGSGLHAHRRLGGPPPAAEAVGWSGRGYEPQFEGVCHVDRSLGMILRCNRPLKRSHAT
jgi:hypothetical protein